MSSGRRDSLGDRLPRPVRRVALDEQEAIDRVLIYGAAIGIHAALIAWGLHQDKTLSVPYTDIDYHVFSDAARHLYEGASPYERETYRYTPLLAWLLVPVVWHPLFGKALFCLANLVCAALIEHVLRARGVRARPSLLLSCLWLMNPIPLNVATRGSCDTLTCAMILVLVRELVDMNPAGKRRVGCSWAAVRAAVVYGFLVHWRVFPVIYGLPILLLLNPDYLSCKFTRPLAVDTPKPSVSDIAKGNTKDDHDSGEDGDGNGDGDDDIAEDMFSARRGSLPPVLSVASLLRLNGDQMVFVAISGGLFLALMAVFYYWYGWVFVYETYLYHLVRSDLAHNFSPYFYIARMMQPYPTLAKVVSIGVFVPQWAGALVLGAYYARKRVELGLFMQTLWFVALNKVCTAQYFLWWGCLMPLAIACVPATRRRVIELILLCGFWLATEFHWLGWAYKLEFLRQDVALQVFLASLLFLCANLCVVWFFWRHARAANIHVNFVVSARPSLVARKSS
ncbi:unnamed protein product [Vitrella brassicaformis CCMP3155]|uniref:GPI mannosyltransferase 1 n=2 Tax=Vitrella brassicaformis TaxID=1169539 RepID=A0A0G4FLV6_VITBC|nr:unnamed protein product [Vitrella brassicaformis CCMP3155]|eukprot:CEM15002.1 unnamed protein product [Vitrella brassicaformis CCMP3155]